MPVQANGASRSPSLLQYKAYKLFVSLPGMLRHDRSANRRSVDHGELWQRAKTALGLGQKP